MRIAMISEHASPLATIGEVDAGGQNVHVAALAAALAQRGHHIVVYTRRDAPDLPERVRLCPGVTVEHLPGGPARQVEKDLLPPFLPQMRDELIERLHGFRPDVVHAHFWMSGWLGACASRALDVPLVQTFHALGVVKRRHQGEADTSPPQRIPTETAVARSATRLTAACTDELHELLALGARRDRVDVIPCGVDIDHFRPAGTDAPPDQIVSVGRLVPRKGVDDVIRALPQLPRARLLIAGGPAADALAGDPEAQRLRALASDLGVADRVRLLGQVAHAELPELMRSAQAVVCTPHYEPFGMVPLEAMACGVPVVGTAVGGLLDTVVDGVTGLLVPPRSPQAVATALGRLLADAELRRSLGAAGRERAIGYAWPHIAGATERVYVRAVYGSAPVATIPSRHREVAG